MSGGDKQTTTSSPWGPAQGFLKDLMGDAWNQYQNSDGYQTLTEDQLTAIEGMKDYYTNQLPGFLDTGQAGWANLMRDPTEVAQSQEVQDMIAANTSGIMTNLKEGVLPTIRSGATGAGQYGGSRQGVAEGVALGKATEAANNSAARITGNVYQQALNSQLQALGMLPMISQSGSSPWQGLFDVGNIERGEAEAEANYPWQNMGNLANILFPIAGMGGTQTMSTSSNPLATLAGLGSTGLGMYGMGSGFGWWGG